MKTRVKRSSPGKRIQLGASVLSAARAIDTRLVKDRLARFEREHRGYVGAQQKVDAAESQLEAAQARLADCDAVQGEAVETLARALVTDGQPRANPFEAFGVQAPSMIIRPPLATAAKAVHQLVAAVQRNKTISKATIQAAQAADKTARAAEQAVAALKKAQASVRDARRMRDAVAEGWESALSALRRMASTVAEEGSPDVYVKLFPPVARAAPKSKAPEEPAPTVTPTQTAA